MPTIERRAGAAEVRAAGRRLTGYAATFNTEARIGLSTESIAPGAFSTSLRGKGDILALVDHDTTRLLARTRSGTLRLSEDSRGLAFDLDLPDTTTARDVLALVERGDVGGMSFAFRVKPGGERWQGKHRTLRGLDLLEISVVSAWPAYDGTSVAARSQASPALAALRSFLEGRL
jgi:HK97 family phage prohead protease